MGDNNKYLRYTWFILIMVLVVILAGGVVRMTQSGMGCPDWPTCFGRWIPPTSADELPPDFEKYLKTQDIDHTFNVWHTWIEYINRLLGALLGLFILIHFAWSFLKFRKTNKTFVWLSLLLLVAVGFQGWLGKKVVDANLAGVKVTTHMLMAFFIAFLPLLIIQRLSKKERVENRLLKYVSTGLIIILLVQVVLGTQVREQVDEISKSLAYKQRELWIGRLDQLFFIHRSFSWLVLAGCLLLFWKGYSQDSLQKRSLMILASVLVVILLGVVMMYIHMPALAQPLHLLMACILILAVFSFRLRLK